MAQLPRDLVSEINRSYEQVGHSIPIEVPVDWLPQKRQYESVGYGSLPPDEAAALAATKMGLRPDLGERQSLAAMVALNNAVLALRRHDYPFDPPHKDAADTVVEILGEMLDLSAIDLMEVFGIDHLRVPEQTTYKGLERATNELLVSTLADRILRQYIERPAKPQRRDRISASRRERLDRAG